MAVFLVNICKFNGCGLTYPSLGDLIQHIEETHIEYDPSWEEQQERQQPSCIPLSSALRFFTNLPQKVATHSHTGGNAGVKASHMQSSGSSNGGGMLPALGRASSTGSDSPSVASEEPEYDIMTDSEDSNDSWTTQEEFSAEFIMRYGSKKSLDSRMSPNGSEEKPYSCPVPGCKKRYKNVNGIKYHAKNGHKKDAKIRKAFKCHCGKSYKTGQGLKNHAVTNHAGTPLTTITTSMGEVLQIPTSQVTTLQPVRVSLSALMGGSLNAVPVKTMAARQLLQTSFKDSIRRLGDHHHQKDEESGVTRQAITVTGVSRGYTIQVAVPASGIIPLSGDKELTAVPVSRLLAQGLGGNIKLAQIGSSAGGGGTHLAIAHAQSRSENGTTTVKVTEAGVRRSVSTASSVSLGSVSSDSAVSLSGSIADITDIADVTADWDPDTVLCDSRPCTPPAGSQRLATTAGGGGGNGVLPPTPVTPGWQGAPFTGDPLDDDDDDMLPPTPTSLLDCGEPLPAVPA